MNSIIRSALVTASIAAMSACASIGMAKEPAQLNPENAADTLQIVRKIYCSTEDNTPIVYSWNGKALSRKQGEKDVHLFDVEGMNIRQCGEIEKEDGTKGFHLVSREILLYLDKDTGEVLKTWENPWTDETVEVMHVANDPVNFKMYEVGRGGKPAKWQGEMHGNFWWQRNTVPLWYPSPLASKYEKEIGGTYHSTELFNFFGNVDELLDPSTTGVEATVGWSRFSDWLPWMNMNGREGMLYMHTAGSKLASYDDLSETMKTEIAQSYPEYSAPPPVGDDRKNMTSWEYYDQVSEGHIELPKR